VIRTRTIVFQARGAVGRRLGVAELRHDLARDKGVLVEGMLEGHTAKELDPVGEPGAGQHPHEDAEE